MHARWKIYQMAFSRSTLAVRYLLKRCSKWKSGVVEPLPGRSTEGPLFESTHANLNLWNWEATLSVFHRLQ